MNDTGSSELKFAEYSTRLSQVSHAMQYTVSGIRLKEHELSCDETVRGALDRIREASQKLGKALTPEPSPEEVHSWVEREIASLTESFLRGRPHIQIVLNLGLVMLCTQFELFVNHLIDVILAVEPRRFMDLFPDKFVKAKEAVELGDYASVMRRLREKVVDEIDRAGTREKFVKYLGDKFGVISEHEITIVHKHGGETNRFNGWDLGKLEAIFEQRHSIVHRGELPVTDLEYLGDVHWFFTAMQTVLTVNAVRKYTIRLDNSTSAAMVSVFAKLLGLNARDLDEFDERVRTMFPKREPRSL